MSNVINLGQYKAKNRKSGILNYIGEKVDIMIANEKMSPMEIKETIGRNADDLTEAQIQECADLLLKSFEVDPLNGYIPIIEIVRSFGIKVYQRRLTPRELSAYISVNPDHYDMYGSVKIACVNEDDSMGHIRFALAHELAHYLFDYDEAKESHYANTYIKDSNKDDSKEKRANYFAANLLTPANAFIQKKQEFEKETRSLPDLIVKLAEYFNVSPKSIIKRFEEVNGMGCYNI